MPFTLVVLVVSEVMAFAYFLTHAGGQIMRIDGGTANTYVGPWAGYGIFWAWIAAVLVAAAFLLRNRDA